MALLPPDGAMPPQGGMQPAMPMAPPEPQAPAMLHDFKVIRKKTYKCARVEGVPPEEFGASRSAKLDRNQWSYAFHYCPNRTEADLIADGYDPAQIKRLATTAPVDNNVETLARDTVQESQTIGAADRKASRPIATTEHYIRVDYEENGKPKLYKVVSGGTSDEILTRKGEPAVEATDIMPFAVMTPYIIPHRLYGRSAADLVMDIQRIKTSLLRGALDNVYLANNQRTEISESHAGKNTIDDLLTNRPGGIVRTKMPGGLTPIPSQSLGPFVYPMIEYMDATREWRTGVTKQGQGLDPSALQNIGENAILDAANAARAKIKLIARIFAETGIRDLFQLLHAVIRKNDRAENTVRLRNKWVKVDPRNWKTRNDMTINVGLGPGSRGDQRNAVVQVLGIQKEAMMAPQMNLVKPKHLHNSLKKLVEYSGLRSVDQYFNDPSVPEMDAQGNPVPPPQPPPDPKMLELQGKMQIEKMQAEADIATNQQKTQSELQLAQQRFDLETKLALLEHELKMSQEQTKLLAMQQKHAMSMHAAQQSATLKADQAKQQPAPSGQ